MCSACLKKQVKIKQRFVHVLKYICLKQVICSEFIPSQCFMFISWITINKYAVYGIIFKNS